MKDADSILRARARALARRPAAQSADDDGREFITFSLGSEVYGVASSALREVFRPRDLTLLPGAEAPVYAVALWRGVLLTILDVRAQLGVRGSGITDLSHVLVIGEGRTSLGVLIHTMHEIVRIGADDLVQPPGRRNRKDELLVGMTRDGVLVLDTAPLLADYG